MFTKLRYGVLVSVFMPQLVFGLCVTANKAYLRNGPGKSFQKTWTVGKYTPLLEVNRKGGWIEVRDQDGETHWVFRTLVSDGDLRCLSVKGEVAALRQGPGKAYPFSDLQTVDRYTSFKIMDMDEDGKCYYVADTFGQKFWIHRSSVRRPVRTTSVSF